MISNLLPNYALEEGTPTDAQGNKAYVFGMIFLLSNKIQRLGDQRDPRLTVKQWIFLAGVLDCGGPGPTLSQVAARIGSSRQNVKKIASLLEKQGFLSMERDQKDGRALCISLTRECLAHLRQRDHMERRFLEELFQGFSGQELSALSKALEKLEGNVDNMEREWLDGEA